MLKKCLLLLGLNLICISFIYSESIGTNIENPNSTALKSRVIISGKSSVIIESRNNTANIMTGKIETVAGGKIIRKVIQDHNINVTGSAIANVDFENRLPTEFVIEKAYPNPFNPTTTIRYGLPITSSIDVAIYDMTGRLIVGHKIEDNTPGWNEFTWQGTDSHGQQVSTGMYLVTMRAGEYFKKQKVTFLK